MNMQGMQPLLWLLLIESVNIKNIQAVDGKVIASVLAQDHLFPGDLMEMFTEFMPGMSMNELIEGRDSQNERWNQQCALVIQQRIAECNRDPTKSMSFSPSTNLYLFLLNKSCRKDLWIPDIRFQYTVHYTEDDDGFFDEIPLNKTLTFNRTEQQLIGGPYIQLQITPRSVLTKSTKMPIGGTIRKVDVGWFNSPREGGGVSKDYQVIDIRNFDPIWDVNQVYRGRGEERSHDISRSNR